MSLAATVAALTTYLCIKVPVKTDGLKAPAAGDGGLEEPQEGFSDGRYVVSAHATSVSCGNISA